MKRRVTLADIAADAGVSRSTVSLVMQGSPLVAATTRERVNAAADKLGYIYHRGAASLRQRKTSTVGLVITDVANPIFAELMLGIESVLGPDGYVVLLANTFDEVARQRALITSMLERQVDGLLVVPALGSGPELVEMLRRGGVPHVLMMRNVPGTHPPHIGADDVEGGRIAAAHLLEHGCSDVVYVGGPQGPASRRDARLDGFASALEHAGLHLDRRRMLPSEVSSAGGRAVAGQLLAAGQLPDGIVCHSDVIAFGLLRELRDAGTDIARECRVIGFDDVEQANVYEPPLTSVSVAPRDTGEYAARMLMRRIADPDLDVADVVLQPSLTIRASCGCPWNPSSSQLIRRSISSDGRRIPSRG